MLKRCSHNAGYKRAFTSHCYRGGAATYAGKIGKSESQIKVMGRWKSGAYSKYINDYKALEIE